MAVSSTRISSNLVSPFKLKVLLSTLTLPLETNHESTDQSGSRDIPSLDSVLWS